MRHSFLSLFSYSQISFPVIDQYQVGLLYVDGVELGTGFVFQNKNRVVTAAHVLKGKQYKYVSGIGTPTVWNLNPVHIDSACDIAILESESNISATPFLPDTLKRYPHELFYFIGWNSDSSTTTNSALVPYGGFITSVGKMEYRFPLVDYFEFESSAIPGYSGSPVIGYDGKVIGVVVQSWYWRPVRGVYTERMTNRAFSIMPAVHWHHSPF